MLVCNNTSMERKTTKGTMAYKMNNGKDIDVDREAKKPKWFNVAQKIKVARINRKAKKKFKD